MVRDGTENLSPFFINWSALSDVTSKKEGIRMTYLKIKSVADTTKQVISSNETILGVERAGLSNKLESPHQTYYHKRKIVNISA